MNNNNSSYKQQQLCNYGTYEKLKGSSDVEDCSKLATRTFNEVETTYPLCEEHYQLLQDSQDAK
jgi:hypothetical protein